LPRFVRYPVQISDRPIHYLTSPVEWDTDFFGFPVADISSPFQDGLDFEASICSAKALGTTLLVYRAHHKSALPDVEETVCLADSKITFIMPASVPLPDWTVKHVNVEAYESHSMTPALAKLAMLAGHKSRFFMDPMFPRPAAEAMYVLWMKRIVSRALGDRVHVLVERDAEDEICAFGATYIDSKGHAVPSLMAGFPDVYTPGFGRVYFSAMMNWFRAERISEARIKTQGRNHAAQKIYNSAGWTVGQHQDIYHVWLGEPLVKSSYS